MRAADWAPYFRIPQITKVDMKRFVNLFLAVTFALLQSIAPVAHAHINNSHKCIGIHLPEIEVQVGHGASELDSGSHVWESLAVSPSKGCESGCTRVSADQPFIYIAHTPQYSADEAAAADAGNPFVAPILPLAKSLRPYPQAPPASLLL
jgi:hypothetical protein